MRRTEYAKDYEPRDASKLRVGIVVSRWNSDITERLLAGAQEILRAWHVAPKRVTVMHVAGSFEIPYVCLALIKKKKPDAVIALGCIIKGETDHDRYIASAVSHGIMQVSLSQKIPVSFGIITANNLKQAEARATGDANKGKEAAVAALEAALLK
ncbi:6,7-dimethyl-8-ribityllumazine synthase [Candidatus Kaiserbacteria bacterium RIFCSPHIGHO2_12_FULL_53_13]|uniref:6,7-dimethyl-8-ribityllumazine synthase n=1 Tax=Candidatus Kaiserbacteria bacterium RIFCSPHIGHO2_12_FULL_53_13 TaxID=1798502 RepID=A0A1F6EAI3_9BACT|nr:MAG: 6,7-dimethyl-8-ribityllumazine synthase [Candidatus Kaiserbacteria bacterium RIFCSPHIGHO2_12_FULL_53_13]